MQSQGDFNSFILKNTPLWNKAIPLCCFSLSRLMTCCENTCVLAWDGTAEHFSQAPVTAKTVLDWVHTLKKLQYKGCTEKRFPEVSHQNFKSFQRDSKSWSWVLKADLNLSAFPRVFHTFWSIWPLLEKLRASIESSLQQRILPTGKIHYGWEQGRGGHCKRRRGCEQLQERARQF